MDVKRSILILTNLGYSMTLKASPILTITNIFGWAPSCNMSWKRGKESRPDVDRKFCKPEWTCWPNREYKLVLAKTLFSKETMQQLLSKLSKALGPLFLLLLPNSGLNTRVHSCTIVQLMMFKADTRLDLTNWYQITVVKTHLCNKKNCHYPFFKL